MLSLASWLACHFVADFGFFGLFEKESRYDKILIAITYGSVFLIWIQVPVLAAIFLALIHYVVDYWMIPFKKPLKQSLKHGLLLAFVTLAYFYLYLRTN